MKTTATLLKAFCAIATVLTWSILPAAFVGAQTTAQPVNSINSVNVGTQQGGAIVVRVTLKQPLANPPAGFTINNPPRIAFDFPDTANALGKNTQEVGEGDLRNMNIVQSGGRTRIVMNLSRPLTYDTKVEGNNVLITLQGTPPTWDFVETVLLGRTVAKTGEGGVEVGIALLSHLLKRFGGDQRLALAAWYQGERAVREHGLYPDTKTFVANVLALSGRRL